MDNVKIYNNIIALDILIREYIAISIPSIHRDIRIRLLDESYNLVKNFYETQYVKGNIRLKYITEILVSTSLLKYLLSIISDKLKVNREQLSNSEKILNDIKKLTIAWKRREEKSNK